MPASRRVAESVLHAAWRRSKTVTDRDGRVLRVIYPGRPAPGEGPDFIDAILLDSNGVERRGDIEIHVRRSGWYEHGHDRDPRYNGVIFHVAVADEGVRSQGSVVTDSGLRIPLLVLRPCATRSSARTPPEEVVQSPSLPEMSLDEAGDRRFFARAAGLELEIERNGPSQTMWVETLECLGYSKNRKPFRRLAERAPWKVVVEARSAGEAERLLLDAAGLSRGPDAAARARARRFQGGIPAWPGSSGRPDNRPERRIAGAAGLVIEWRGYVGPELWAEAMLAAESHPAHLIRGLSIGGGEAERALIGRGRAIDIAINAVLPIAYAAARSDGRWALAETALRLYREFPKASGNSITREMIRLVNSDDPVMGARQQQGLIYLYRAMTRQAVAETAPVFAG